MKANRTKIAKELKQALEKNQALVEELQESNWPLEEFQLLQGLQQQRMARDYKDLLAQDEYAPAIVFFLNELYGGLGFIERNDDLNKVYSIMTRMLPDSMLDALATAMAFQALSIRLDMDLTSHLVENGTNFDTINLAQYARANKQLNTEAIKRSQIASVIHLGKSLQHEVSRPFALRLLKLMRLPAKAAGFGKLHDFLETGLAAFLKMPDISRFLEILEQRETKFLAWMFEKT